MKQQMTAKQPIAQLAARAELIEKPVPLPVRLDPLLGKPDIESLMCRRDAAMREYLRLDKELWFAMKAKENGGD